MSTTRVALRRSGLGNWVGVGDETYPTPPRPVPGVVLLQRDAACCRREHQHSEVGRNLRPDLKARLGRKRGAFRTPRSLPVFSTRRRRERYKNPNAAGRAVWVNARGWGRVASLIV